MRTAGKAAEPARVIASPREARSGSDMLRSIGAGLMFGIFALGACGEAETAAPSAMDPLSLLTRHDPEPAGANCARGGVAVRSGFDRNGDGALGDGEIEHTDYVCDGSTTVLTRQDAVAPGLACPLGGLAVKTGIDDDGDGALSDAEIDDTTYVCGSLELWNGDFTREDWNDAVKVAALAGARIVTGSLTIPGDPSVELPRLEVVAGALTVTTQASAIALPALREVAGRVILSTGSAALALPALRTVHGNVIVSGGDGAVTLAQLPGLSGELHLDGDLSRFDAPDLDQAGSLVIGSAARGRLSFRSIHRIRGDLQIHGEPEALALDNLLEIEGSVVLGNASELDLSLPRLETVRGDLRNAVAARVTRIDLPGLRWIGGRIQLTGASALTALALPIASDLGGVAIEDAPALVAVDLGALRDLRGDLRIVNAPALTTLALTRLFNLDPPGLSNGGISVQGTAIRELDLAALRWTSGIDLTDNPALRAVQLPFLTSEAALHFVANPALETVVAPRVEQLAELVLADAAIRTLDFAQLSFVDGALTIDGGALADLSGLRSLWQVSGALSITRVDQLRDLRGLASLRGVLRLELRANPALTSLDGLERIMHVWDTLSIVDNAALASVAGLRNLTHVNRLVELQGSPALIELALTRLASIDGGLRITAMDGLTSLSGLDALASLTGDIEIRDNRQLPDEAVLAFKRRLGQ